MKKFTLIATTFVLCGSLLSIAEAGPLSVIPTAVVKVADLDIAAPAGKKELYRRVSRAARAVCSAFEPESGLRVSLTHLHEACVDKAVAGAVAQINRADFTGYVATLTHKPVGAEVRLAAQ
jgi:UrcA family protein